MWILLPPVLILLALALFNGSDGALSSRVSASA
jgi:hypothetical protein